MRARPKWLILAAYDASGERVADSYSDPSEHQQVLADLGEGEYLVVPLEGARVFEVTVEARPPIVTVGERS